MSEDRIREILQEEFVAHFRAQLPKMVGSIKSAMVEYFDERYVALSETAAVIATAIITVHGLVLGKPFNIRTLTIRSPQHLTEIKS